ncbi:MAG: glycine-rich domain-containing protein-like [Cyanobacteria bacterium P01_A01_bin.84]
MKTLPFLEKLKTLELENVARKLMSGDNGCSWTEGKTKKAIARYRRFLYLQFLFPEINLSPTKEIDEVWHAHILLDTQRYMQDCLNLYGYILHHRTNNSTNISSHQKTFEQTKNLFEEVFGMGTFGDVDIQIAACSDLQIQFTEVNQVTTKNMKVKINPYG